MARTDDRFRQAYNALLDQCITLLPGEQLAAETALAQNLNVSRTVVRAVLERLNETGIIKWEGREKVLLRVPADADRLLISDNSTSDEELEQMLLDWILRFDVPPGAMVNVTELARRFAVPAHALQSFLASLSRFGLVRRHARGGWEMIGFTRDYAIELSDFRMMLELNAISHLLTLPPEDPIWRKLDELELEHRLLAEQINERFHDFSFLDERFHNIIGSVIHNRFAREFQKVIALIFHYHYQWDKKDERERNIAAVNEHLRLIEALKWRDQEAALAAARDHLHTSKQTLLSSMRNHALA